MHQITYTCFDVQQGNAATLPPQNPCLSWLSADFRVSSSSQLLFVSTFFFSPPALSSKYPLRQKTRALSLPHFLLYSTPTSIIINHGSTCIYRVFFQSSTNNTRPFRKWFWILGGGYGTCSGQEYHFLALIWSPANFSWSIRIFFSLQTPP